MIQNRRKVSRSRALICCCAQNPPSRLFQERVFRQGKEIIALAHRGPLKTIRALQPHVQFGGLAEYLQMGTSTLKTDMLKQEGKGGYSQASG